MKEEKKLVMGFVLFVLLLGVCLFAFMHWQGWEAPQKPATGERRSEESVSQGAYRKKMRR